MKEYTIEGLDFHEKELEQESLVVIYKKGDSTLSEYDFEKYNRDFGILGYRFLCAAIFGANELGDSINESIAGELKLDCSCHRALWSDDGLSYCLEDECDMELKDFIEMVKSRLMNRHPVSGRPAILDCAFPIIEDGQDKLLYELRNPCRPRLSITRNNVGVVSFELEDLGEVAMRDKEKALYLLYIAHPEGIALKSLIDYRDELLATYLSVSNRCDTEAMTQTVDDLVNPLKNAANEAISHIKKAFELVFEAHYNKNNPEGLPLFTNENKALKSLLVKELSKAYVISGDSGSKKAITLNRRMVVDLR